MVDFALGWKFDGIVPYPLHPDKGNLSSDCGRRTGTHGKPKMREGAVESKSALINVNIVITAILY
jgi:hypothetical protein